MKIYHWINKYNEKICYEIINRYSTGIRSGKPHIFSLYPVFWPYYTLRFFLVFLSIVFLKKDAYQTFYKILFQRSTFYPTGQFSPLYIKTADIFATLFGFRYLSPAELLPLLNNNQILKSRIEISSTEIPFVSIVIPINQQLCYIYNTLLSIQKNTPISHSFEIIVIDETIDENIRSFFRLNTQGILYLSHAEKNNSIFSAWNLGAQHAKGELICFLNDSIYTPENWIEPLIKTLESPEIGSAGGKIIDRNGLLNHAGGIVYSDGSIQDYGKGLNADHPYYNYQREVDYSSSSAIIFRKEEYIKISNDQSCSAFTNNIDADIYVRHRLGKKVLYQPLSFVIQTADVTISEKTTRRFDSQKWNTYLNQSSRSENINTDARRYHQKKTILFIDDVIPAPDQDSGSNRLFSIMKIVKSLGYHVIFVPNDAKKRGQYFDQMIQEGFEVLYRFPNRKGMIQILLDTLQYIDLVWICKPHNNELFSFIFDKKEDCLWIYDTIDLHYLRIEREGKLTKNNELLQLAQNTKSIELSIARRANITIAITRDEQIMLQEEQLSNVAIVPNIHEIKHPVSTVPRFENRRGLLFIGGYLHKPNIDAAEWLVKHIMPKIWETDPSIKLTLLGSNPTEEILSYRSENVIVPGYINDVTPYFNQNRVFVAPLRFGAGMKGKIGQSLEYNLPIVSTHIGIEGMGLIDGHHVIVANNTEDFAAQTLRLYHSAELWNTLQCNASQALEQYTPKNVSPGIRELFDSLGLQN